jgi:hypothetical protein
LD